MMGTLKVEMAAVPLVLLRIGLNAVVTSEISPNALKQHPFVATKSSSHPSNNVTMESSQDARLVLLRNPGTVSRFLVSLPLVILMLSIQNVETGS